MICFNTFGEGLKDSLLRKGGGKRWQKKYLQEV